MKLIHKDFDKNGAGTGTVSPEESEDLWHLYNLVSKGDTVKSITYRKIQKEGSTGSVQTEVKKLMLTIDVKQIEYDAAGDCIRFSGKNCEESQWVKMGAHHTIEIQLNSENSGKLKITVGKKCWDFMDLQMLEQATDIHKSAEVGVLLMEAGTANFYLLTAVLAKTVHKVSVTLPRKRLTTTGYDKAIVRFFEQVYQGVKEHIDLDLVKCVVLGGPGFVKDDFLAWMLQRANAAGDVQILQKKSIFVSTHTSCCHKQALKELLADEAVQKSIANTKAALHLRAIEEFYAMVKNEPDRICYGPKQVHEAVEKGAVGVLMVVDSLFRNANLRTRQMYVEMTETVKDSGTTVHIFSSQHVSGEQLAQLGGVAATLRFPMPELDDIDSEAGLSDDGGPEEPYVPDDGIDDVFG